MNSLGLSDDAAERGLNQSYDYCLVCHEMQ